MYKAVVELIASLKTIPSFRHVLRLCQGIKCDSWRVCLQQNTSADCVQPSASRS